MRTAIAMILFVPLLACSETAPTDDGLKARQEAACKAAIADHIRRPAEVITTRWISETDGRAEIEARDDDRLHICDVDAAGNLLDYRHPRP